MLLYKCYFSMLQKIHFTNLYETVYYNNSICHCASSMSILHLKINKKSRFMVQNKYFKKRTLNGNVEEPYY